MGQTTTKRTTCAIRSANQVSQELLRTVCKIVLPAFEMMVYIAPNPRPTVEVQAAFPNVKPRNNVNNGDSCGIRNAGTISKILVAVFVVLFVQQAGKILELVVRNRWSSEAMAWS